MVITKRFSRLVPVLIVASVTVAICLAAWPLRAGEGAVTVPPATQDNTKASGSLQFAVLSGGCFWGVQGVFEHVHGVRKVMAGYAGGAPSTAEYETVSTGTTGHAESVQITFDPAQVSYGELLRVFFSVVHDPTEINRQGPDVGTQYRSEIFYMNDEQKKIAEAYIAQLNGAKLFSAPIATRVDAYKGFFPAEGYHQDFLIHNPNYPYIVYYDIPKIKNLQRLLPDYYVSQPVMVSTSSK